MVGVFHTEGCSELISCTDDLVVGVLREPKRNLLDLSNETFCFTKPSVSVPRWKTANNERSSGPGRHSWFLKFSIVVATRGQNPELCRGTPEPD